MPRYKLVEIEDATGLDPKLCSIIAAGQEMVSAQDDSDGDEATEPIFEVIAKVRDPKVDVYGLRETRKIGQIVTGTVNRSLIKQVRRDRNVISLKLASKLRPALNFSVPEINATPLQIRRVIGNGSKETNGEDVIIGVVDSGCDFRNANFRKEDGKTRILYLWDQRSEKGNNPPKGYRPPKGFGYGREFTEEMINDALDPNSPKNLYYKPPDAAHGTLVLDVAAGNGRGTGTTGVAPKADLIFVDLANEGVSGELEMGSSKRLLEAVEYIFKKAEEVSEKRGKNIPAVVNISLGAQGGPHDGSTLVEQGFDTLLEKPGRAIVISAGNFSGNNTHVEGTLKHVGESHALTWEFRLGDPTENEMEIWYGQGEEMEVTLISPEEHRLGPVKLDSASRILDQNDKEIGRIFHRKDDPNNRDNQVYIWFGKEMLKGYKAGDPEKKTVSWTVVLQAVSAKDVHYHAWIERDDLGQSTLRTSVVGEENRNLKTTLGSIACGKSPIVVGAYDPRTSDRRLTDNTSHGPTRDGKEKPEVSAPGSFIRGARALSNVTIRATGTSAAAPHVAGVIALMMQAAGRPLSNVEIREALIGTARKNSASDQEWHPGYGRGQVDAAASVRVHARPESSSNTGVVDGSVNRLAANGAATVKIEGLIGEILSKASGSRAHVRIEIEIEPGSWK